MNSGCCCRTRKLGTDGFHDVLIDNLSVYPTWRSSHISPADVTSLRRRWPKAVFRTMQRRAKVVEHLRRFTHHWPDRFGDLLIIGQTVSGDALPPVHSPESSAQALLHSAVAEEDVVDTEGGAMDSTDTPAPIIPPPPGFRQFSWPNDDWKVSDDPSLFTFMKELPGWFPWNSGGLPVDMPSPPLSPIVPDSLDDSVTANMGSSREESITPSEVVVIGPPVGDVLPEPTDAVILADSPLPTAAGLLADLLWAPIDIRPQGVSGHGDRHSPSRIPRWRLAREGPFLAERSPAALSSFGAGCAFRNTSYRASDYASPSGEFAIPLNHLRFLEWIGVPESASLLEIGPGRWLNALSPDKAMAAAIRLQLDVCLMTTNLDILDQYALSRYCIENAGKEPRIQ